MVTSVTRVYKSRCNLTDIKCRLRTNIIYKDVREADLKY